MKDLQKSLIYCISWRIWIFIIGLFAVYFFKSNEIPPNHFDQGAIVNMWAYWDSWHYMNIAENSYPYNGTLTAFFPLFPLLIASVKQLFQIPTVYAGLIVSHIGLFFSIYFFLKLLKLDYNKTVTHRSIIYLLCFPSAVFLGTVYTEPVFLASTIACFYFARKKQWLGAFIAGFLAALTRNLGILLVIPLAIEYFSHYKIKLKPALLTVMAPILGVASYMYYLNQRFGDPLLFLSDQKNWERSIELNIFANVYREFKLVLELFEHHNPWHLIQFGLVSLVVILSIYAIVQKKIRTSYIAWMILLILPPILQNMWTSTNRYVLVIFPLYIVLAKISEKYRFIHEVIMIIFTSLLAYHTAQYVNFMWAG